MNSLKFEPHENLAFATLKKYGPECTLFLKRDNEDFPISKDEIQEIGLYGNGVRRTLKGGTGSGDVEIHYFLNIEQAFEQENIKIKSKNWLNQYDIVYKQAKKVFIKRVKKEAKEEGVNAAGFSVGYNMEEPDYDFLNLMADSDINIYVLSRQAGESRDKKIVKGDYYLTDTEIRDILYLQNHSKKFLLVINSASLIDLSPIAEKVSNIFLLSFLGSKTSETLVDIVLGRAYPSGKLNQSWDVLSQYPSKNFGDINDTDYQEGIFVGYRYFTTKEIRPLFPFGFGLSYTRFNIEFNSVNNIKDEFLIKANVINKGNHPGKEVVQLYLSKPSSKELPNPKIELVAFAKTIEIKPNEENEVSLVFRLSNFSCFDAKRDAYILPKGIYHLSLGSSSIDLKPIISFEIEEDVIVNKVKHIDENQNLIEDDYYVPSALKPLSNHIKLKASDFVSSTVEYRDFVLDIDPEINKLSDEDLAKLSIGNMAKGLSGAVGWSCESVQGGAGETTRNVPFIKESLNLVDGPAGLRISKECIKTRKKNYKISMDPLWLSLLEYLPKAASLILDSRINRFRIGEKYYQYTTSLPVSSAIACSFSKEVGHAFGEIIQREMNLFGCNIWLAPAMNIIRNPLCGRNFEYYSEDPLLTSEIASSIIESVQSDLKCCTTVKHFACNNQETNRFQSSSNVSIRALREIYLRGFERVIKKSHPFAVMTSYNLINGSHPSESPIFLNDILRCEFNHKGIIMSDWISTDQIGSPHSKYPTIKAHNEIKGGLNLVMPGNKKDILDIKLALQSGELSRDILVRNSSFIYKKIKEIKSK